MFSVKSDIIPYVFFLIKLAFHKIKKNLINPLRSKVVYEKYMSDKQSKKNREKISIDGEP
ncbi:MAG: hypothetical protein CMK54_06210 [Proteobacteria bacterium]|nr:hypothetical protein [Pseudomonadota bacterium]